MILCSLASFVMNETNIHMLLSLASFAMDERITCYILHPPRIGSLKGVTCAIYSRRIRLNKRFKV